MDKGRRKRRRQLNITRDIEILDSRVSKLLIMLKKHIKEGDGGITEEQLIQKLLDLEARIVALETVQ